MALDPIAAEFYLELVSRFGRLLRRRWQTPRSIEKVQHEVQPQTLIVVLFGGGGRMLQQRRRLAEILKTNDVTALVPEDDFPRGFPSIVEIAYLRNVLFDLAFIFPESWGSATEFGQFLEDSIIAPKMVVLVPWRYHPIYGQRGGYLSDACLKHLAKFGHVYAYNERGQAFPRSSEIIVKLCRTRRALKLFQN